MIDFVTGVFLTVRKTALCQERTSSIIAPLRLELPALPALLPALDVPVQGPRDLLRKGISLDIALPAAGSRGS